VFTPVVRLVRGLGRSRRAGVLAVAAGCAFASLASPANATRSADPDALVGSAVSSGGPAPVEVGPTTLAYRGLTLDVPAGWAVYDLERSPQTCVRFDRQAVYLGTPGTDQRCPARAVGRTDALLVQPASADLAAQPTALGSGGPAASVPAGDAGREVTYALEGTGLAATVSYGFTSDAGNTSMPDEAAGILDGASYTGPERATPFAAQGPRATVSDPPTLPAAGSTPRHRGQGFDTCGAPSLAAMRAWLASPFRTVGIYIGGVNRACPDGNLSASWVETNARLGWRMLPIYVGRQAPCAMQGDLGPIQPTGIAQQGTAAANDAVARARGFGLQPGTTIYFDMEAYDDTDAACRSVVLAFLNAWTKRLHDLGFLSGVYSSAASGIRDLARVHGSSTFARPDAIWIARWNNVSSVFNEPMVPNTYWGTHQRLKQYRGPHTETWGGHTIEIDSDVVDGPLAAAVYRFPVISGTALTARRGPNRSSPAVRTWAPGSSLRIVCQIWTRPRVGTSHVWDKLADGTYVPDMHVGTSNKKTFSFPIPKCRQAHAVWAQALGIRKGTSPATQAIGKIRVGGLAYISCQKRGTRYGQSSVWNKLDTGGWVPDWYTVTPGRPGFTAAIPRCP
jgi:Domain of unknown function (DUF1906)